jgi:hypothetical protein
MIAVLVIHACASPAAAAPESRWGPQPVDVGRLRVLAAADASGFRLHTEGGERSFLPGVNLGATTPLHQPGEVGSIERSQYATWIAQMGRLGIRAVRIYTLHPPGFYQALRSYNLRHRNAPIYLIQGVYLPDESFVEPGRTLYDRPIDRAFAHELADTSDAVHGALVRSPRPGRSGGRYAADVSPWVAAWIVGMELDGESVQRTDRLRAAEPAYRGRYFEARGSSTATERWLARHMDRLAAREARRGTSVPIAFVNWPTTDPMRHPTEPLVREDMAGLDALHIRPTTNWPGGTFASFHAYPYYPDFQRYEPGLDRTLWKGKPDRYAGYLAQLRDHFAGAMPVLITEFGVPSSLGSAHLGIRGRDQGGHSEQQAMALDAEMLRVIANLGLGGAFVFAWTDEWFKRTWNTMEHQVGERRQLWHDPLTNEQWFGLYATDARPLAHASVQVARKRGPIHKFRVWADASWVHLVLAFRGDVPSAVRVDADVIPGPGAADYRLRLSGATATLQVRRDLDPIRLDTPVRPYRPDATRPWHTYALIVNGLIDERGHHHPAEFQPVGQLVRGSWNPKSANFNSLATWRIERGMIRVRLPWSMLGLADPSSHRALGPGVPARMVRSPGIRFTAHAGGAPTRLDFRWRGWNRAPHSERPKAGLGVLAVALRDVTR